MSHRVRTNDFKEAPLNGTITELTSRERWVQAFKRLGLFWALAVGSVPIPVAHLVLVPSFLFVGIVMFIVAFRQTHVITEASFVCPHCGKPSEIKKHFFSGKTWYGCPHCQTQLRIVF